MTVYVVGGSNSRMKDGWVSRFRDHAPDLVNLSIGATTSITGLFRVLTTPEIGPGDVIVWEYALNEANHIRNGHAPHILLGHVEHFLRHLRERGVAVAPVVFTPRMIENRVKRTPYYVRLHQLFAQYGLKPFDMSVEYRAALGVQTLPKAVFQGGAHYAHTDEILDFIANGVVRAVGEARIPSVVKPKFVRWKKLQLIVDFANETFENSIMRQPVARPPIRFTLAGRAQVAAVTFFSSPVEDAFEVIVSRRGGDTAVAFSATHQDKTASALLKTALVPPMRSHAMAAATGSTVRIGPWRGYGRLVTAYGCKKKLAAPSTEPLSRIAGVFVVTQPWWVRLSDLARSARRRLPSRG